MQLSIMKSNTCLNCIAWRLWGAHSRNVIGQTKDRPGAPGDSQIRRWHVIIFCLHNFSYYDVCPCSPCRATSIILRVTLANTTQEIVNRPQTWQSFQQICLSSIHHRKHDVVIADRPHSPWPFAKLGSEATASCRVSDESLCLSSGRHGQQA